VDNKNSPLNLLEEMKQHLGEADRLRQKMEERLRTLYGADPRDAEPGDRDPGDEGEER
jgi:hypothetical protein